jgi:uncharacterized repeat protein (TIGR04138 family)
MTLDPLRRLALADGRYAPEAFEFLMQSLEYAVRLAGKEAAEGVERHVTGQEVLTGMRAHAKEAFGPLAAYVWRSWGIRESMDWGRIVFLLVENNILKRQDGDKLEDFDQPFDFEREFVDGYKVPMPGARGLPGPGEAAP